MWCSNCWSNTIMGDGISTPVKCRYYFSSPCVWIGAWKDPGNSTSEEKISFRKQSSVPAGAVQQVIPQQDPLLNWGSSQGNAKYATVAGSIFCRVTCYKSWISWKYLHYWKASRNTCKKMECSCLHFALVAKLFLHFKLQQTTVSFSAPVIDTQNLNLVSFLT